MEQTGSPDIWENQETERKMMLIRGEVKLKELWSADTAGQAPTCHRQMWRRLKQHITLLVGVVKDGSLSRQPVLPLGETDL